MRPTRKVTASAAGGAAAIVLTFVLGQFGVDVGPEVAGALSTLGAFAGGFFRREVEVPIQVAASQPGGEDANTELFQGK